MADPTIDAPHPVDVHVGAKVRLRRKLLNMSQETLAGALGLTFQQIQKYERGANRISASRLYEIAFALGVPMTFFFDGLDTPGTATSAAVKARASDVDALLTAADGIDWAQAINGIKSADLRRKALALTRALSQDDPDA